MKAEAIVATLLEVADPDDLDPLAYADATVNPQPNTDTDPERLTRALRDALVERVRRTWTCFRARTGNTR